jgi:hypothetical protein
MVKATRVRVGKDDRDSHVPPWVYCPTMKSPAGVKRSGTTVRWTEMLCGVQCATPTRTLSAMSGRSDPDVRRTEVDAIQSFVMQYDIHVQTL